MSYNDYHHQGGYGYQGGYSSYGQQHQSSSYQQGSYEDSSYSQGSYHSQGQGSGSGHSSRYGGGSRQSSRYNYEASPYRPAHATDPQSLSAWLPQALLRPVPSPPADPADPAVPRAPLAGWHQTGSNAQSRVEFYTRPVFFSPRRRQD